MNFPTVTLSFVCIKDFNYDYNVVSELTLRLGKDLIKSCKSSRLATVSGESSSNDFEIEVTRTGS